MKGQARTGTAPEIALRRLLYAQGHRYRVAYPVPGLARRSIDIAFPGRRLAVFVDGCFWHRCPIHYVPPKNNSDWWKSKLDANVARDLDTDQRLAASGWTVVRCWEHEDPLEVARLIERLVAPTI